MLVFWPDEAATQALPFAWEGAGGTRLSIQWHFRADNSIAVRVVMLLIGGLLIAGSLALTIRSPKSHTESDLN